MKIFVSKEDLIVVFCASSGAGKTTLKNHVLDWYEEFAFSTSHCAGRPIRPGEEDGKDYFFTTQERFIAMIGSDEFFEYEEVYPGCWYGTSNAEIRRIRKEGYIPLLDIDVVGTQRIKQKYGDGVHVIFIKTTNVAETESRLRLRGDIKNEQNLKDRLARIPMETKIAERAGFDFVLINDDLDTAKRTLEEHLAQTLGLIPVSVMKSRLPK